LTPNILNVGATRRVAPTVEWEEWRRKMGLIPDSWVTCYLEELLIGLESGSRPRGGVGGIEKGIPSIGGEHLTYKGTFDFSSIRYVPEEFAKKMNKGHIRRNDILIVKDGATTGKTALVDGEFPYEHAVVNEHVFICRPSELIEPRFLFRYLMCKEGQDRILENFQGSAQGGINLTFASNTEVFLVPLNEQRRIVAKLEKLLSKVDACKERLGKVPIILRRFRQSVLASAYSGRLTTDWREKNPDVEPAEELLKRIREKRRANNRRHDISIEKININNSFELPESWSFATIEELEIFIGSGITPLGGKSVYKLQGIPFIRSQNVRSTGLVLEGVAYITSEMHNRMARTKLKDKDVLLNITGASIGRATYVPENFGEGNVNQHVCIIRLEKEILPEYTTLYLNSPIGQDLIFSTQVGVTREGLNYDQIRSFILPIPSLLEQQEMVRRVEALFKVADQIEQRYKRARAYVDKLTQSILAKAFRGELVSQDPNDEPASVLLERIREERSKNQVNPQRKKTGARKQGRRQTQKQLRMDI
jgi:type I restriction enzyme S subunit